MSKASRSKRKRAESKHMQASLSSKQHEYFSSAHWQASHEQIEATLKAQGYTSKERAKIHERTYKQIAAWLQSGELVWFPSLNTLLERKEYR